MKTFYHFTGYANSQTEIGATTNHCPSCASNGLFKCFFMFSSSPI